MAMAHGTGQGRCATPWGGSASGPSDEALTPKREWGEERRGEAEVGGDPPQLQHIACSDFPTMPVYAAPRRGQSLLIEILCACPDAEGLNFPMFISQHVNQQRPCCLLPQISPQPTGLLQHCGLSTTLPPHCPLSIESTWSSSAP